MESYLCKFLHDAIKMVGSFLGTVQQQEGGECRGDRRGMLPSKQSANHHACKFIIRHHRAVLELEFHQTLKHIGVAATGFRISFATLYC
jgi:hypothetical protein